MKAIAMSLLQEGAPSEGAAGVMSAVMPVLGCLFLLGALVGMIVCARASRRPTANRKAVSSLAVVLTSPFIGAIIAVSMGGPESRAGTLLSGVLMVLGVLAAILLAVLGLIEVKRQPERWKEGTGFAVAALSLSGLLVLLWTVAVVVGVAGALSNARTAAQIRTDYKEFGFRIEALPPGWRTSRQPTADASVRAQFSRNRPEMYFMILAEKVEGGVGVAHDAVARIVKANLQSKTPGASTFGEEKEFIQGMEGVKLLTDIPQGATPPLVFRHWVHAGEGWIYQLVAWSAKPDQEALLRETDGIFRGFRTMTGP